MAGYSAKPLAEKLGLKKGQRALVKNAPHDFMATLAPPSGVLWQRGLRGPLDCIILFVASRAALTRSLSGATRALAPAGMLWVAWPKKASKVTTDLSEDRVRESALAAGLVDVKVCAMTEIWSGLKLVRRLADR